MPGRLDPIDHWPAEGRKAHYNAVKLALSRGVTPRRLQQHFRQHLHATPQAWLRSLLLLDARVMVEQGLRVKDIAIHFGYTYPTHFTRAFRREYGCSPREHFARTRKKRP